MLKTLSRKSHLLVLVSLLLVLAFTATACGSSTPVPTTAPQNTTTTKAPTTTNAPASSTTTAATSAATSSVTQANTSAGGSTAIKACPDTGAATTLTGAGATFPGPLYTRWFDEYAKQCNIKVNYQAIGSGGGIKQITEKTVDFGASDGIMTDQQKKDAPGTIMIPMTSGPVAVVVNLQGVTKGQLKLTPETLAGIYLGTITKWSDPKIAADNSGLKLPDQAISVIRRSDGSGTTNIFTTYLAAVSADWKSKVGAANSVQWPVGLGGEGNAGVAGQVKQIPGSIGYVELAYATQNNMTYVALKNQAGKFIEPSLASASAAADGVEIPDSTEVMITNSANPEAYPIVGFTWIIVYEKQTDAAKAQTLATMLWWAIHDGQKLTADLGYPSLSPKAVAKAEAQIKKIQVNGQPVIK
jgi:phosphate transport system substrate-binding protein